MNNADPAHRQGNWYLLTGILLGLILGMIYAWGLAPGTESATSPAALRPDFKDQYRLTIASAYQDTGDLERAISRLALLGDPDPVAALNDQAQRTLLAGNPGNSALSLSTLAQAIQQTTAGPNSSPQPPGSEQTSSQAVGSTTASTSGLGVPAHPSPTQIPSPTPGAPFAVAKQENICNSSLPQGLLEVDIHNAAGQGVPGVELIISWSGHEDHFFTGFKPELDSGYADYVMTPGISYSLQLGVDSSPVSGLTPPSCPGGAGKTFWGSIHLVYQQP